MIKNIVFDLGGVLVDWNPEYLFKDVFSSRDEMDHFLENICNRDWNEQQDVGRSISEAIRVLLERYGLAAGESLFIDDSAANVQSAEQLGFQGVHLVDGLNLKDELISRGINGLP